VFELPHSHSAFSTNALGCCLTLEVEAGKEPGHLHDLPLE